LRRAIRETAAVTDRAKHLGFLQLCAERRFHRATMQAFEHATGLMRDD
jgi:hypothetical protein